MTDKKDPFAFKSPRSLLEYVWRWIKYTWGNLNTRYELSKLSDRHLEDIGFTREAARNYRNSIDL